MTIRAVRFIRAFLIVILALAVCQFGITVPAAAISAKSTAHCWADIQDSGGHELASLGNDGVVDSYTAYLPNASSYQVACENTAGNAMSDYLKDHGHMCHVFFAANGGTVTAHDKEGSHGWEDSGRATTAAQYGYPGSCFAPTGHVFPAYYIFTLIYAPPGCTPAPDPGYDCGSQSSISYGSDSTNGTTTTIENSLESNTELEAKYEPITTSLGYDETSTNEDEVEVKKTSSASLDYPGSGSVGGDGVNHDFDIFYLIVNPSVAVSGWHDPVTGQNHAQWSLGTKNGAPAVPRRVEVAQLRCALAGVGPRPGGASNTGVNDGTNYDPTGSCQTNPHLWMTGAPNEDASGPNGFLPGLTYDDYKQILSQDPFWNAGIYQDLVIPANLTGRYERQSMNFDYSPPGGPDGKTCPKQEHEINDDSTDTLSNTEEQAYKASMAIEPDMGDVDVTLTQEMTFTNKTTHEKMTEHSEKATADVYCPSAGWTGNGQGLYDVAVYYDNLYGTFMFGLSDHLGRKLSIGTVKDADGDQVPHQPLTLTVGNRTYGGFSHTNGTFEIPARSNDGNVSGPGTLFAGAVSQAVDVGSNTQVAMVIPTPPPSLSVTLSATPPPADPGTSGGMAVQGKLTGAEAARLAEGGMVATQSSTGTTNTQQDGAKTTGRLTASKLTEGQMGAAVYVMGPQTKGPFYIAVKNASAFARAKNVTVTAVQAVSVTGQTVAFGGTLPYVVPAGTVVLAGHTLVFTLPLAGTATQQLSLLKVTIKADNLAPFPTTLVDTPVMVNAGSQQTGSH